jgi:hypothetical protein
MSNERARVGRRAFIALGAGVIGGCVQGGTPGGGGTGQATDTRSEVSPPTADSMTETGRTQAEATATNRPGTDSAATENGNVTIGIGSERSEPQTTETIGGTTGNEVDDEDAIMVWNDAETARRISVIVEEKAASGEPSLRETYRFKPDSYITIGVQEAGEYAVTVGLDGGNPETIDFSADDCNDQSLFVTVTEDGAVKSNGMSTLVACATVQMTTEAKDNASADD